MEEEEVGPTEEIVQALLESMVEPLLGRNSKEVPTLDQQKSMAKQVFLSSKHSSFITYLLFLVNKKSLSAKTHS